MGRTLQRRISDLVLAVCASALFAAPCIAQSGNVAVVVNSENPVSTLTVGDLRKLFAGEKRSWPHGVPVKLIVRAPGCRERLTMLKLLNMSESDYKQYWTGQVLRGEADSEPWVVPSVGMQREALKTFPGAVTLVDAKDVKPGMKIVKLEGLLPDEPGYPLH
jgi:hypothetical protein